jgi:hypothetical protein
MKRILFATLVFASACALLAQEGEFRTETRLVNQRTAVVITGYNGTSKRIYIPAQIGGLPVAGIGDSAFRSRRIESVTFPSTLVFIGNYAFYDNNLTGISIPPTVTNIGTGAFDNNAPDKYSSSANLSQSQRTTYARSFTIEPAHSETVYQPRSNPPALPASEKANIIVVPSYNPLSSSTRSSGSVLTVQQSLPPAASRTVPTTPVVTANHPALTDQTSLQSYEEIEQLYNLGGRLGREKNQLFIIPETIPSPPVKKEKPFKLHLSERTVVGRTPPPQ